MIKKIIYSIAKINLPISLCFYVATFFMRENYYLMILHTPVVQMLYAMLLLSLFYFVGKHWSQLIAMILCTVILGFRIDFTLTQTWVKNDSSTTKVAHFNVLKYNNDYGGTIKAAGLSGADLFLFRKWITAGEKLW